MKFSDIPAQESVKKELKHLADSDRLPHALLLSGPSGAFKLALARALAQYIHCRNHVDGDSCGVCPECLQHQSVNYPDMHYVYPVVKRSGGKVSTDFIAAWRQFLEECPTASYRTWTEMIDAENSRPMIYVEESAAILHAMNMSNFAARYKVMIIWLPEKMGEAAANKLLKIIEEPFADTKFIFVSNEPQAILPTIFSRTQRIEVPSLTEAQTTRYLIEKYHLDEEAARASTRLSGGDINMAIGGIDYSAEGKEYFTLFCDIMRKAYTRDVRGLKDLADDIAAMGREKICRFTSYCTRMLRENFISALAAPELLSMNSEEAAFSARFAPFINFRNIEKLMEAFDSVASDVQRNANPKIVLFDTFLSVTALIRNQ